MKLSYRLVRIGILVAMSGGFGLAAGGSPGSTREHSHSHAEARSENGKISVAFLEPYLAVQNALAGDSMVDVRENAGRLADLAVERNDEKLAAAAREVSKSDGIQSARVHFRKVSDRIILLVEKNGLKEGQVKKAYCPMAFGDEGAEWLQEGDVLANPYYGATMLRCGVFRAEFRAE